MTDSIIPTLTSCTSRIISIPSTSKSNIILHITELYGIFDYKLILLASEKRESILHQLTLTPCILRIF